VKLECAGKAKRGSGSMAAHYIESGWGTYRRTWAANPGGGVIGRKQKGGKPLRGVPSLQRRNQANWPSFRLTLGKPQRGGKKKYPRDT